MAGLRKRLMLAMQQGGGRGTSHSWPGSWPCTRVKGREKQTWLRQQLPLPVEVLERQPSQKVTRVQQARLRLGGVVVVCTWGWGWGCTVRMGSA